jgi:hypothetical protein
MRRLGCLAVLTMAAMAQSASLAAPRTVDHLGKKFRFLSLAEARAIALERSNCGQRWLPHGSGFDSDGMPSDSVSICVLAGGKPGSKRIILAGVPRGPRRAEYERNINQVLLNIENAYWNLYSSYWQLYGHEQGLRLAYETWKLAQAKYKAGRTSRAAVAQAEGQYNLFRSQHLAALDTVMDNERQLWAMMGLPIENGTWLVPSDAPTLVEQQPDWKEARLHTLKHRPELRLAQREVMLASWNVAAAKQAREFAKSDKDVQTCDAGLRQAELREERARQVLDDQGMKSERFLGLYYRRMSSTYFQIKAARAQREAFAKQLRIRAESYKTDSEDASLDLLLEAQRFWADALTTECQAIVTYNNAIAGWEYAKGDLMKHAHVHLTEEAPEGSDAVRAVVREHKRTRQHVRREPGVPADSPLAVLDTCGSDTKAMAPSLPALWKRFPPLKEAGDTETGLVERQVSEIFPPHRVHGGVSP